MRFRYLLLRLLLCLALVVNGMSAVHAGVGMALAGGTHAAAVADDAGPACHDGMERPADAAGAGHAPQSPGSTDACCPPGGCLCDCTLSAPMLSALLARDHAPLQDVLAVTTRRSTHTSPTLSHLIRPPIG